MSARTLARVGAVKSRRAAGVTVGLADRGARGARRDLRERGHRRSHSEDIPDLAGLSLPLARAGRALSMRWRGHSHGAWGGARGSRMMKHALAASGPLPRQAGGVSVPRLPGRRLDEHHAIEARASGGTA